MSEAPQFAWTASVQAMANGRDEGVSELLFDGSLGAHGHGAGPCGRRFTCERGARPGSAGIQSACGVDQAATGTSAGSCPPSAANHCPRLPPLRYG